MNRMLVSWTLAALTLAGCGPSGPQGDDATLRQLISDMGLRGDPIDVRAAIPGAPRIPSIVGDTDPVAQAQVDLGKYLFFSRDLSAGRDVACVSCHHMVFGGGDNVAIPVGVDPVDDNVIGPGRLRALVGSGAPPQQIPPFTTNGVTGNAAMPRNSPTVFGLAFWDKSVTWDGTVSSERGTPGMVGSDSRIVAPLDLPPIAYDPLLVGTVATRADLSSVASVPYRDKFDDGMLVIEGHGMFPTSVLPAMRGRGFRAGTCVPGNPAETPSPVCVNNTAGNYTDRDIRRLIAARFDTPAWNPWFQAAFGDAKPTPTRISRALVAYERTMTFTQSPWRAYVKGDEQALSPAQKRGAVLFFAQRARGGANCASCHAGDFFTDERYYPLAVPQIGRGKGNANSSTDNNDDWGRGNVTGLDADKYAFRVPTLLNVEMTGPWGHTGVFDTLDGIVRHHLDAARSVAAFNESVDNGSLASRLLDRYGMPIDLTRAKDHTRYALDRLLAQRAAGQPALADVPLTDAQVADLVAFLKALTDPCTKDHGCLAKWVPLKTDRLPAPATAANLNLVCPKDNRGNALIASQICP